MPSKPTRAVAGGAAPWQRVLVQAWRHRGVLAVLLLPLSALYLTLVVLRRLAYRCGLRRAQRLHRPVLVVGNAVAGGAGKTPTVIALVQHLQSRGIVAGVISRGYGRHSKATQEVLADSDPREVGDEPLLIARRTGAPVFVSPRRLAAGRALLQAHPHVQLVVCDDGLQHYALYRDVEICVFDERGVGNGWVLPSGPLREPWPRHALRQCGQDDQRLLILHTGPEPAFAGHTAQRALAEHAVDAAGRRVALSALAALPRAPVALAGIARPERFFEALREAGLALAHTVALPDHGELDRLDLQAWSGHPLLCTEKDAVKLWRTRPDALAVPLHQWPEPAFHVHLESLLRPLVGGQVSSGHGHQTA